MMMRGWKSIGVVETIYEEDCEFSPSSSSLAPSPSFRPTPLNSLVGSWSFATGKKPELLIQVCEKCFNLHKEPLTSRSTYLKRLLTDSVTELTLSPPLNISAETFTLVADFCYGARLVITPFNLAAIKTAAELLEMTETHGDGDDNLVQITDSYFRQVVAVNPEYTSIVFRSCLALLPEAETRAFLLSECVEALNLTEDDNDVDDVSGIEWFSDVVKVRPEDFHIAVEAIRCRFTNHDVVYMIVDLYLRGQSGNITEEQKIQICNFINCSELSPQILLEAVQNPIMPLRFIVRAMMVEQHSTRRCILSSAALAVQPRRQPRGVQANVDGDCPITLGAILERDAAFREAQQLKATLKATSLRVQSLEQELDGMKKMLTKSDQKQRRISNNNNIAMVSSRCSSFHNGTEYDNDNKMITMGDRLSASSSSIPFDSTLRGARSDGPAPSSTTTCKGTKKKISRRLMSWLKKAVDNYRDAY
ncbi:hypothetical protein FNV43_RR19108 [Rhamnella rubrinervis]|uniref:Uncharacterized protein n=1 Tax=Rhamnella rubrinervis TaxID=2594499 RepID=A0A8K0E077_9ROSA|nr:hypothetical protein FNV43_RR19108 [Rhamnella rubrinervis]